MGNTKSLVFVIISLTFLVSGSICSQLFIKPAFAAPQHPCFGNPACGSVCVDGGDYKYCCWAHPSGTGNMCQLCVVDFTTGEWVCGQPNAAPPPPPSTEPCPENTVRDPFGNCAPMAQTLEAPVPKSAPIQYTHRRILDDSVGNKVGWDPNGQTKVFGIVDSKFNPQTSIVLINTFNPVLPGVVCDVDHRGYAAAGPAFEVNCGGGNPSAVAPMDGTALDYLIITMPFSPPDAGIFNPTTGGVIPRINMTDSSQIANQTQIIRSADNNTSAVN